MHNPSRWDLRAEWLTLFSSSMYQPCYSVRSLLLLVSIFVMFDYFSCCRKIPRDLTEASLSGAGLSIVAALTMMFLFGMVLPHTSFSCNQYNFLHVPIGSHKLSVRKEIGKIINDAPFCLCRIPFYHLVFCSIADFSNHFLFLTFVPLIDSIELSVLFFRWLLKLEHQQDGLDSEGKLQATAAEFWFRFVNCDLINIESSSLVTLWTWNIPVTMVH